MEHVVLQEQQTELFAYGMSKICKLMLDRNKEPNRSSSTSEESTGGEEEVLWFILI
jgi:hypothetical protein